MMNTNDPILSPEADVMTVAQLALCFGVERSVCRRWLNRNGFRLRLVRLQESGNQLNGALSGAEAREAISLRKAKGFKVSKELAMKKKQQI
jgi:hypothetical protein